VNGGKKGKRQGIEGSANANVVWVWMMPHIRFCAIGKCDTLSVFLLIESLPASYKFHPLFLVTRISSYDLFCFSILAPFFLRIVLFAGKRFHLLEFSRRIT
jgi:hypothetical protein